MTLRARNAARTGLLAWRVLRLVFVLLYFLLGVLLLGGAMGMFGDVKPSDDDGFYFIVSILYVLGGPAELYLFLKWLRGRPSRYRP